MAAKTMSAGRLAARLQTIARISDTEFDQAGITRLAYTETERAAHRQFRGWMTDLGLRTWSDSFGNSYAEYAGDESLPAIGTGSHLDSVPGGGRFDGIVGVIAAAEVAEYLVAHRITTRHPIRFVAFAGEEGARFGQGLLGSKGAAGLWTAESIAKAQDADGISLPDAMAAVGLSGDHLPAVRWRKERWRAFVELHVEQGTVLADRGVDIGIVHTVSGSTRIAIEFTGQPTHSGGTPMAGRHDALCAAAEIVLFAERWARESVDGDLRCTTGRLDISPGSMTTIPGSADLWVDVRGTDLGAQRAAIAAILEESAAVGQRRGVSIGHRQLGETAPTQLPEWPRSLIREACEAAGRSNMELPSGASHDAQMIASLLPTAVIFVQSIGGLSHVPGERTEVEDIAMGTEILADTLLRMDRDD